MKIVETKHTYKVEDVGPGHSMSRGKHYLEWIIRRSDGVPLYGRDGKTVSIYSTKEKAQKACDKLNGL